MSTYVGPVENIAEWRYVSIIYQIWDEVLWCLFLNTGHKVVMEYSILLVNCVKVLVKPVAKRFFLISGVGCGEERGGGKGY